MNRRQLLNLHFVAAVVTGFCLAVLPGQYSLQFGTDPVASWQASAAFAKAPETKDMPAVAPSFGKPDEAEQTPAHSKMTLHMKSPTLQGSAVRQSTTGGDQGMLEGSAQRDHIPNNSRDPFTAAGIARTDDNLEKPKPARIDQDVYRAWLSKAHPQFSLHVQDVNPIEVLEVKGTWDKADKALKNLGIPHRTIGSGELNDIGLARTKVLVINCAGTLDRNSLQGIRDFVMRGGYLLTTDWALDNMLRQTFPGYVEWNKGKSKGNVVDAHVVMPDREFFGGTVSNASWKLDEESQTIRILKPDAVKVLAISHSLATLDPDHQGILAVTFSFGRGKVLHLVGHFDNNSLPLLPRHLPDPAPIIGIGLRQALAANFVVSALEHAK